MEEKDSNRSYKGGTHEISLDIPKSTYTQHKERMMLDSNESVGIEVEVNIEEIGNTEIRLLKEMINRINRKRSRNGKERLPSTITIKKNNEIDKVIRTGVRTH